MQQTIGLEVVAALADGGFSLDELVIQTRELFEREGLAGFVALLLNLVDEAVCLRMVREQASRPGPPCCAAMRLEFQDQVARQFRTSVGTVRLRWRRLRCVHCGKSHTPLREFLGLTRYQSKSAELERVVTEVVSEQSYRRASRHLELIGEIPVPKTTAHRWICETACDQWPVPPDSLAILAVDGTGFKRRPDAAAGLSNRGDLLVALGVTAQGAVVPVGAWTGRTWEQVGQAIRTRTAGVKPLAGCLVSDGETDLVKALTYLARRHQRCHWHMIHDLDAMMWRQDAPLAERRQRQQELARLIRIEIPATDLEQVPAAEKSYWQQRVHRAERQLGQMAAEFAAKGYQRAATYIRQATARLFSYVEFWLQTGIVAPRTTSWLERLMRELGRRLKRIAFGWSDAGAAKMARILIRRLTNWEEWEEYWRRRLRVEGKVMLIFRGVKVL